MQTKQCSECGKFKGRKKHICISKPRTGKYLSCKICKKKFYVRKGALNIRKYCSLHCAYQKNKGKFGKDTSGWKGGKFKSCGYIFIRQYGHPSGRKYVPEHRLIMEKHLGRYLKSYEIVHHKNGIKNDNRIENLRLVIIKTHFGKVKCPHCQKDFFIK